MTLPTIHLNGTSKQSLIDGYCDAYDALNNAYEVLKQTAPNGRDFYPQGPEAFKAADNEHMARLRKIDEVLKELQTLSMAIDEQGT